MMRKKRSVHNNNKYLLFAAPSLMIMLMIMIFPVCYAIYYSFFNFKLGGEAKFVGLGNYIKIIGDSEFHGAIGFSVLYTVITVACQVILGMCIALLMDNISKGRKVIATLIYLPYFISASVCGVIFKWLFMSNWGLVTQIIGAFGIKAPEWFSTPTLAKFVVMLAEIWQNTPFAVIIFYAGLQSVSMDLVEAASLDGASAWQRFWNVKLPALRHLLILVLSMRIMDAFRIYDRIAVMTAGGPGTSTASISLYAYKLAFTKLRIGRGCAAGVLILILMIVPVFVMLKLMRSEEVD